MKEENRVGEDGNEGKGKGVRKEDTKVFFVVPSSVETYKAKKLVNLVAVWQVKGKHLGPTCSSLCWYG